MRDYCFGNTLHLNFNFKYYSVVYSFSILLHYFIIIKGTLFIYTKNTL